MLRIIQLLPSLSLTELILIKSFTDYFLISNNEHVVYNPLSSAAIFFFISANVYFSNSTFSEFCTYSILRVLRQVFLKFNTAPTAIHDLPLGRCKAEEANTVWVKQSLKNLLCDSFDGFCRVFLHQYPKFRLVGTHRTIGTSCRSP